MSNEIISGNNRIRFDKIVHNNSNETVTGTKTFTGFLHTSSTGNNAYGIILRNPNLDLTNTTPSDHSEYVSIAFCDANGAEWVSGSEHGRLGNLEIVRLSSDIRQANLTVYKQQTNSILNSELSVGIDSNNIPFALAPSTSTARTAGTDIVTRNFIPNDTRIVHTTGNETIDGEKTFTDDVIVKLNTNLSSYFRTFDTRFTFGTTPASTYNNYCYFCDSIGTSMACVRYRVVPSSTYSGISLMLRPYESTTSLSSQNGVGFYSDDDSTNMRFVAINGNNVTLGVNSSTGKWKEIWCKQSSINSSSDERLKQQINVVPDEVLDVWENVNWSQFKFNDSVIEKGEDARLHVGLIAQELDRIFKSKNCDISKYGFFLYDEWKEELEEKNEDGTIVKEYVPAGNEYGLRYTEVLCLEAAYQRRKNKQLEQEIQSLKEENASLKEDIRLLKEAVFNKQ